MSTKDTDDIESIDVSNYSYHREPPAQGGSQYVRCEVCGGEALLSRFVTPSKNRDRAHNPGCALED